MACAPHLLIVEDNRSLRQMLTWEFEDLGYRVTATDCCAEAMRTARQEQLDMALLDYNLPDGCGADLVTQLRAINPQMQIILSSGYLNVRECDYSLCHFEPKPISAKKLHQLFQSKTHHHA
ncbi:response regulator [Sedimenticola sp.]|uniref:response regulator n=1 Tax=Sedimenticola sp. TaxID=1940285 RepID=UPI003D10AD8B